MYLDDLDRVIALRKGDLPRNELERKWLEEYQKFKKDKENQEEDYNNRAEKAYQEGLIVRYEFLCECSNEKGIEIFKDYEALKELLNEEIDKEIDDILLNNEKKANELFYIFGETHLSSPMISEYRKARRFGILEEKYGVIIDFDKMDDKYPEYSQKLNDIAKKYDVSEVALSKKLLL